MKKYLVYLIAAITISCSSNNASKEAEQQKQIDSLNNIIKQRDDSIILVKKKEEKQNQEKSKAEERNSMVDKVYADMPTFTPVSLGGFRDIRFNLFNDSKYNLEQVIVKVHYIKANGVEVNTETQTLRDISPKSHIALTSPDYTAAGKSLRVTVETILCKAINLCYYNEGEISDSNDPYKCK